VGVVRYEGVPWLLWGVPRGVPLMAADGGGIERDDVRCVGVPGAEGGAKPGWL
jgi:hypothetical protein